MAHPRDTLSDQCTRVELGRKSCAKSTTEEVYHNWKKLRLAFRPRRTEDIEFQTVLRAIGNLQAVLAG